MEWEIKKDEVEAKKEKLNRWLDYLSILYSQPLYGEPTVEYKKSKEVFLNLIKPEMEDGQKGPEHKFEWDFEQLERLQAMQKGG